MAGATLLFMLGKSVYMLLLARMLQGLAGAAVGVVGFALLAETVDKSRLRQAMGHVSLALNWGMLLGPSIGGLVYEKAGYYAVFAVPAGLLLVDMALRLLMIEKAGQIDDQESTVPSEYGTIKTSETQEHESEVSEVQKANAESSDLSRRKSEDTLLLRCSSITEQRREEMKGSMVLVLLKEPRVLSNLYGVVFTASLLSAFSTTLPLFVMRTFHWTSAGAGFLFVFLTLPSLFGFLVGRLMDRKGGRVLATAGCLGCAVCLILLRLVHDSSNANVVAMAVLLLLIGTGTLILRVANMAEIGLTIHGMQDEDPEALAGASPMGQSYALLNMAYASGEFIGPILGGFMSVKAGWNGMTLMWGVISFLTAVPVALFMGGWVLKPRDKGKRIQVDE
ncbi:hypothetical protein MMC07_003974 [Pseudocyphellaria aurata]|nr:hypothetical protein [Pseudocyphellaria aurata]